MRSKVEKMRPLSNELRNVEMIRLRLILNERTNNEKSYKDKTYVVRSTTGINLLIIQPDNKSFHGPKLLDVSTPGLSMWF